MIEFLSISVKNFCSYGNHPSVIQLNEFDTTLVVGKNGRGKSTILLDGIFFALFGKPYRKVTKTQLINTINNGGTLVEVSFKTRGSVYTVRRGIKPNLFEILKDDALLDSNTLAKDLQEHLEQDILQLNIRTFGQTTVLGSASFIPFMQLDAAKRREVVDDVLNVGVYTKMSKLAKEDLDITSKEIQKLNHRIDVVKTSVDAQRKLISVMETNKTGLVSQLQDQIDFVNSELKSKSSDLALYESSLVTKKSELPVDPGYHALQAELSKLQGNLKKARQKIDDIESIDSCPSCLQKVSHEHKQNISTKTQPKLAQMELDISALEDQLRDALVAHQSIQIINQEIEALNVGIRDVKRDITKSNSQLADLIEKRDDALADATGDIQTEKQKLKEFAKEGSELVASLSVLKQQKAVQELSVSLLKDSGIKARVVKEYLPVINQLINRYLKGYEFEINFDLDENFDETINSRGRQNFTYHSFSEGEKEKIDYAIMLALRQIAASKNAAHINILVLDEILDGSLDEESRSATLNMLASDVEQSNIFVISHTESNPGYYDNIIKVDKRGDFSFLTQI